MTEILAPAGDSASFYAALNAGADAIYLGLTDFSARKSAANFTLENLSEYTSCAHVLGAKVYVALNTLIKDTELENFFESARKAWNAKADALIIQDVFLGKRLHELYPEMELHLSTQAGVCNEYGARLAKRFGFSRVILARETPLEDIRKIATILETEVFVQGALCTCFSGQCYMSSLIGGNSGNRGLCKQPCRKRYTLNRNGFESLSYKLSLSDLCVGNDIVKLMEAGAVSFKIEGRMRSAAYVASAVKYYKDLLSGGISKQTQSDFSDLRRTYNRGNYTKGYAFGQRSDLISSDIQGHIGEKIGTVQSISKNDKYAFVRSDFVPRDKDGFKVIRDGKQEVGGGLWRDFYPTAKGGFNLTNEKNYKIGDGVYLTNDHALTDRVLSLTRKRTITIDAVVECGQMPCVTVSGDFGAYTFTALFVAESAKSRPFSSEDFKDCFLKTDNFPFAIQYGTLRIGEGIFIVKSALNSFRRDVYQRLFDCLAGDGADLPKREMPKFSVQKARETPQTAVIDRDFSSECYKTATVHHAVFKAKNYKDLDEIHRFIEIAEYYAWHKWLYLPAFSVGEDLENILEIVELFDGVYADGVFALEFCREHTIPLFAGSGFNLFNSVSVSTAREEGVQQLCLSKELSSDEQKAIGDAQAYIISGSVKAMDLGHCLFGKTCKQCDRRDRYCLTDESGREFPLLRYENSVCRFELYNTAPMVCASFGNRNCVLDCSALTDREKGLYLSGKGTERYLSNYTFGALKNGIS